MAPKASMPPSPAPSNSTYGTDYGDVEKCPWVRHVRCEYAAQLAVASAESAVAYLGNQL